MPRQRLRDQCGRQGAAAPKLVQISNLTHHIQGKLLKQWRLSQHRLIEAMKRRVHHVMRSWQSVAAIASAGQR